MAKANCSVSAGAAGLRVPKSQRPDLSATGRRQEEKESKQLDQQPASFHRNLLVFYETSGWRFFQSLGRDQEGLPCLTPCCVRLLSVQQRHALDLSEHSLVRCELERLG